jgi:hypothetical protein
MDFAVNGRSLFPVHETSRKGKRYASGINRVEEYPMRKLMLAIGAASLAVPAAFVLPATSAQAQHSRQHHHRHYKHKEWRGRDGRRYCRKSDGTVGTVVGGVAGALLGRTVDTHGDRTTGTVLGAAGGALAGHAIDKSDDCR